MTKMNNKLVKELRRANRAMKGTYPPGSIHAHIPALVTTDLAAGMLEIWRRDKPPMDVTDLITAMSASLAFLMESFKMDDLPPEQMALVENAADALYALAPHRARMPVELIAAARAMHGERVVH